MDELNLVRELRPEPELPSALALLPARSALLRAIAAERSAQPVATEQPAPVGDRRHWRSVVTGLGVAAAAASVLVLAPWHGPNGPTSVAAADPVVVLDQAARYATDQPFTAPRPDQFLYFAPGLWLSVDGTQDGGSPDDKIAGCKNGQRKILQANNPKLVGTTEPCMPDPAYLSDVPTTVPAMRGYLLRRDGGGDPAGLPNRLGKLVDDLFRAHLLSPAATAALFHTMTTLPGLRAVPDVVTMDGQHGIGITWDGGGGTATMVFDRSSHRYLGAVSTGIHGEKGGVLATAPVVVDRLGELPR